MHATEPAVGSVLKSTCIARPADAYRFVANRSRSMKLFTINSYGDEFLTGETNDGRLVLMGLLCPKLVAVFFGSDGRYASCENYDLTMLPPRIGVTGVSWETDKGTESIDGIQPGSYQIYDPAFRKSFVHDLDQFKRLIGFTERAIRVQQFHVDAQGIGIDLLPDHLAEFKENPTAVAEDEDDHNDLQESLDEWENAGNFVLWWAKDYWFGPEGEVEST